LPKESVILDRIKYLAKLSLLALIICPGANSRAESSWGLQPLNLSYFSTPAWEIVTFNELQKYDKLFALSDIHGQLSDFLTLLDRAQIAKFNDDSLTWNNMAQRILFVAVGDYIDKGGDDGAGTLLALKSLQDQAMKHQSRVIVLLGNHEATYLGHNKNCSPEFLKSVISHGLLSKKANCDQIAETVVGKYMASMPIGAVVGTWIFGHSGFINVAAKNNLGKTQDDLKKYFTEIKMPLTKDEYNSLADASKGFIGAHNWLNKNHGNQHDLLDAMGISGMITGHEASILGGGKNIAVSPTGWLTKVDVGMNREASLSHGKLLTCKISDIKDAKTQSLRMLDENKKSLCSQLDDKGQISQLDVGSW
jgi:hypothetical protein